MDILSSEEDNDTISFLPHGRAFIIYKKKKFATEVLPKFFKATKFTSFTRKLNRWGFGKLICIAMGLAARDKITTRVLYILSLSVALTPSSRFRLFLLYL
jgi:hypothetical protein